MKKLRDYVSFVISVVLQFTSWVYFPSKSWLKIVCDVRKGKLIFANDVGKGFYLMCVKVRNERSEY